MVVPAFYGTGSPYWDDEAKAAIVGMTRTTKKAEIVKAATESIAYQIADVFIAMEQDFGGKIAELRADGGPTKNTYLMQFTADMTGTPVSPPRPRNFRPSAQPIWRESRRDVIIGRNFYQYRLHCLSAQMGGRKKWGVLSDRWKSAVESVLRNHDVPEA